VRFPRLLLASCVMSAAALNACGAEAPLESIGSTTAAVSVQKTYPRKIYVHVMPWFQVGGQHWSMNARNGDSGVASWYAPMIGEYNSNDGNVIEYQLLTMKYAGIDGVLIDWPGLNGGYDRPQNKANSDAIIARTAAFGMEFGVCYEDQYADSLDAAKGDMAYVRDNFFTKPNHIKVNGVPALLVFGPQKFQNPGDWTSILSVFSSKPQFYPLWYNDNAGSNASGKFAWIAQNALKGVNDFDAGLDGVDHGNKIPIIYPGFNPFYAAGGWPGPTWKVSYDLKQDNTAGGDTMTSSFELGKYAGEPLQIATWNDYGEGTMIEPSTQGKAGAGFGYRFLMSLQKSVGTQYTDAELKIVKLLYDQRKQFGGSKQAELDLASQALANLDVAKACTILGCTAPVHTGGGGGATGAGGATAASGAPGIAGAPPAGGGAPSMPGGGAPAAGGTTSNPGGGAPAAGGQPVIGGVAAAGSSAVVDDGNHGKSGFGSCSTSGVAGPVRRQAALLFAASALGLAAFRRRRRRS